MFMKFGMRAALIGACALALSGCITTTPGGQVVVTPPIAPVVTPGGGSTGTIVTQVQEGAAKYCGAVPTYGTIASIIATFTNYSSEVALVRQIIEGVCNALTTRSYRRGGPSYRGVKIRATRVQR